MVEVVPNRDDLLSTLPKDSDAAVVVSTFEGDDIVAVRAALRALVASWEEPSTSSGSER